MISNLLPLDNIALLKMGLLLSTLNPLYTGGLFHCYMVDESICHFRGVRSLLLLLFYF